VAYNGPQTNHTCNGLLSRSDLHTLFDLGKLAIDTKSYTVLLAQESAATARCLSPWDGDRTRDSQRLA